ncbi:MAG: hypothetical protein VB131_05320, partial [Burkholderia gladioli]
MTTTTLRYTALGIAAAVTTLFGVTAHAQSSVTLYGLIVSDSARPVSDSHAREAMMRTWNSCG